MRVRTISGSWVIEPDPGGGTRATYTVQSDPGGTIPAWLVNRLQVRVVAREPSRRSAGVDAEPPAKERWHTSLTVQSGPAGTRSSP